MILEIVLAIVCGLIAGTVTGLIPGIHINLISMVVLVNFGLLIGMVSISSLIIFIVVMGTTHTFVDFIPSVLFGVPSSDTALSVLPAHQLVLEGKAYKAIYLSSIGSLSGVIFSFAMLPLFYIGLDRTYELFKPFIPYILLLTIIILIIMEKKIIKILYAVLVTFFAGGLGLVVLNTTMTDQSLLLLFTGLFGISSIFFALKDEENTLPKQSFEKDFKADKNFAKAVIVGGLSSTICSVSPGLGSAQAGTLAALFFKKLEAQIFIVVVSAINTINFILSFMTLYLISRARNGAVFVIAQITDSIAFQELILYFVIILVVSILAFLLTLYLGKKLIELSSRINFRIINFTILVFLVLLILILARPIGLIILLSASALGILCLSLQVRRVHMMSILLVPVILNLI